MKKSCKPLKTKGWMFQFIADETLAKDAVAIYDFLGYEVHLQSPNRNHSKKSKSSSSKESGGQCQIVYIRPKKSQDNEEE